MFSLNVLSMITLKYSTQAFSRLVCAYTLSCHTSGASAGRGGGVHTSCKHAWDIILNRFIGMVYSMVRSKNEKLSLIALSGLEDKRSIIAQNVDKIRCKWKIRGNIADIAKMKDKCAIYRDNKDGFVSRTQMVKELRGALQGGIEIESLHREDIVEILK